MERVELTDDLRTDLPSIDAHHVELFRRGNLVLFPEGSAAGLEPFRKALRFLSGYVYYHFAAEEFAMKHYGFKDLGPHKGQHDLFRSEIAALVYEVDLDQPSGAVRSKLHSLLQNWFTVHIGEWDKRMAGFLRGMNVPGLPEPPTLAAAGIVIEDLEDT